MKIPRKCLVAALTLGLMVADVGVAVGTTDTEDGEILLGQVITGRATYYNEQGDSACGRRINPGSEMLVAVSTDYRNDSLLCSGISVEVTYQGRTITVPVEDLCASCDAKHIDLSEAAFLRLAPGQLYKGILPVTWKFVRTDSTESADSGAVDPFQD